MTEWDRFKALMEEFGKMLDSLKDEAETIVPDSDTEEKKKS